MLAIIGGSKSWEFLSSGRLKGERLGPCPTPYGPSQPVHRLELGGRPALFLPRHGEQGYRVSAPFVNYRANIYALKEHGASRIVAWSGPGAISPALGVGQFVVPDDILDETRRRPCTFFEGAGHGFLRQNPVFCAELSGGLAAALRELGLPFAASGTYVCTEGPRLETPAEIRKYAALGGHLVGMTLCPEVFLARELEMCYAALCYVTNRAEGIEPSAPEPGRLFGGLASEAELQAQADAAARIPDVLEMLSARADALPHRCSCGSSMLRYKTRGSVGSDWHTWIRYDTES